MQVVDSGASDKDDDVSTLASKKPVIAVTANLNDHGLSTIRSHLLMSTDSLCRPCQILTRQ